MHRYTLRPNIINTKLRADKPWYACTTAAVTWRGGVVMVSVRLPSDVYLRKRCAHGSLVGRVSRGVRGRDEKYAPSKVRGGEVIILRTKAELV